MARGAGDGEDVAAAWLLDVMDGLASPLDLPPGLGPGPRAAADGYRRLFGADFAGALEQVRSVRPGGPYLRAVRRQVEALCTASVGDGLDVGEVDLGTVEGAMALFHTCEAAHVAGDLARCSTSARAAIDRGIADRRAATWVRLAEVRALLFQGEVARASSALDEVEPSTPLAVQAVRCLQVLVAGVRGDVAAVVALAEEMRSLIVEPSTYADSGLALIGAFGLASCGLPAAAAELLRFGAGGSGLPLLPPALRAYGYDLLIESALAADNAGLAHWLLADFELIDLAGNAHLGAARDAARARVRIAAGEAAAGAAEALDVARAQVAAGSELVGLRALLAAAHTGPDGVAPISDDEVLMHMAGVSSSGLQDWVVRELEARGRRPRPLLGVGWDRLSAAQRVVARLAARGLRNGEIARLLVVSPRTVEVHIAAILDALEVDNRVGIVGTAAGEPDPALLAALTSRRREVALELVGGRSNAEIAASLGIGVKAVEKHVSALLRDLGVGSRAAAAARLLGTAPPHP